jgi:SpoIID/LytB domain protein
MRIHRLAPAILAVLLPWSGRAFEMTRKDRLAVLHSDQVIFDRHGEPLVSVRISEGTHPVAITSKAALTLLPGGDDGHRVRAPAGARWTVSVEGATPGKRRYWVAVERIPAGELERAAAARERWRRAGHEVSLFESGALLGLAGHTLDTRVVTVAIDPSPTEAEANGKAAKLAKDQPLPGEIIAEAVEWPEGWIIAREAKSGIEVRARDLLWITPDDDAVVDLPGLEWGAGTPHGGREDRSYEGDVYFTVGQDGRLSVVNVLSAERLLAAVVPSELFPNAPLDALRAQAIAARGELLAKIGTRHRADPYVLCAETHCQVYAGVGKRNARTTKAVEDTRGQLLFDEHGLVDTVYSSSCGGHGEAFHLTWGGDAQAPLVGRPDTPGEKGPAKVEDVEAFLSAPSDAYCKPSAEAAGVWRWTATRRGAEVSRAVDALADIGPVVDLKPVRRGQSGRVLAVEYVGTKGRYVHEGEYPNRTLLGNLKSGLWVVERQGKAGAEPDAWVFRGGGFGHGVGLCQHGAIGMAGQGLDYKKILEHYYPGSRLEKVW